MYFHILRLWQGCAHKGPIQDSAISPSNAMVIRFFVVFVVKVLPYRRGKFFTKPLVPVLYNGVHITSVLVLHL